MKIIQDALALIVLESVAAAEGRLRTPDRSTSTKRRVATVELPEAAQLALDEELAFLALRDGFFGDHGDSGDMSMPVTMPHLKTEEMEMIQKVA